MAVVSSVRFALTWIYFVDAVTHSGDKSQV